MAAAKKLAFNVYATDPDGGDTVFLKEGTKRSDIPERILPTLGDHLWADDDSDVDPAAPAPAGGVTGQDPASVDRDGDGVSDGAALVDGSVKTVLGRVGNDPAKAQAALAAETGDGGQNRTSLVSKLQAVAGTS